MADWKQLPDSIIDPITLEPINELTVEPFKINQHYFDGEALAAYLVASSTFENPLDRKALTRDDCQRLDAHLARNKLKRLGVERERRAAQRRAMSTLTVSNYTPKARFVHVLQEEDLAPASYATARERRAAARAILRKARRQHESTSGRRHRRRGREAPCAARRGVLEGPRRPRRGVELCHSRGARRQRPCLLYTSPSPREGLLSRMPSSA